jgi:anti-anti-sigma factor
MELALDNYFKVIFGKNMVHTFQNRMIEEDVITYSKINDSTILLEFKIARLDIYNVSCIKEIVDTAYNNLVSEHKRGLHVILNCESIEYIDSSAVGALLNSWKQLNKIKKSIVIYNVKGIMKQTLKNLDLDKFFMIFDTLEHSIKWLKDRS